MRDNVDAGNHRMGVMAEALVGGRLAILNGDRNGAACGAIRSKIGRRARHYLTCKMDKGNISAQIVKLENGPAPKAVNTLKLAKLPG
jgi:hypothetical protein